MSNPEQRGRDADPTQPDPLTLDKEVVKDIEPRSGDEESPKGGVAGTMGGTGGSFSSANIKPL